jgi:IPT/TIG domain
MIAGSGFISSSTVQWNGTPIATTYNSATSLSITLAANNLANATVARLTVVNPPPGGGTSAAVDFSVNNPMPAVTNVSPSTVVAGASDTPLDVMGSGFVPGSVVAWNETALTTTFVSTAELKATVPAADLSGSSASQITIHNQAPGGGTSAALTFSVNSPTPSITAISPQYVPAGMAATITLTGTGFESNSVALWNNSARPTTFVSSTSLTAALTAADLQNQGTGSLTVSNPAPGAATSQASTLTVTLRPVIQNVIVAANSQVGVNGCAALQATVTGQGFASDASIQANGVSLALGGETISGSTASLIAFLPPGFVSAPGALSFTVTNPDNEPIVSTAFPYPASSPAALALCAIPSPTTVFPGSTFSFTVQPSWVNVSGNGALTLGTLPTGVTWANTSVPLPPTGTFVQLQAASTTAAGTYDLMLNGAAGGTTAKGEFNFTVSSSAPPSVFFSSPLKDEMGVPIGGSGSLQFQSIVNSTTSVDFDITPSVSSLPPGTTATFQPAFFLPGQSVTVTLTAASNAPVTQNAAVLLTGTPSVPISNATVTFFADVTQPPGSLPGNRSDFLSTGGTPYGAVYDAARNLIFSSNPSWNRVDVISNTTHQIVRSIAVRSPRGIDITQDNSTVWVQTAGINVYAINTSSLQTRQYALPSGPVASYGLPVNINTQWDRLLALADGTLFVYFNDSEGEIGASAGIWNPQTNQMTVLVSGVSTGLGTPARSGDGTLVYATGGAAYLSTGVSVYTVGTKTFSTINSGTSFPVLAVNHDGSRVALGFNGSASLYDQHLNLLGTIPGTLASSGSLLNGGILFSADGTKIYEMADDQIAGIVIIDASSLSVSGIAPATLISPVGTSGANALAVPFAIDASGMVLGRQNYGISFDDSTFVQNYAANQPSVSGDLPTNSVFDGPLSGGTVFSPYLFPDLTPDVWFGQTRGSASVAGGQLSVTSPPSTVPGPVNIKMIFPDGEQIFAPEFFTYSTYPEYAVLSGSSPSGGAPGQVLGYGLPLGPAGGTLTVGGNQATITPPATSFIPFSAEPFPSTILSYTFPPGTPGLADLTVTTPNGGGTLPKSIFYAESVTDYSSPDTFAAVLFDPKRNQVYLSAGNHIDVFSTTANQFVSPLTPAAQGATKEFAGLALTPDGSTLLAADLTDGSLALINPDLGSSTVIPIVAVSQSNGCTIGPLYVAATANGLAFVGTGSLPTTSCAPSGPAYVVNLQTQAVSQSQCSAGVGVDSSSDGNFVVLGSSPCIYAVQSSSYTKGAFPFQDDGYVVGIAGDANIIVANEILADLNANMLGAFAQPLALYGSANQLNPPMILLHPRFNASGSLFYLAYPGYFEIIDVQHAVLRMRFSLTETVQYNGTPAPMAIDSGGRFVYLITDRGLTVVDLGAAPLSIGHLTPQTASVGTQVTVRGSGFDSTITATVGGAAAVVSVTDQNTLTLTIPAAASGPEDIVLTRGDGEVYTLDSGLLLP